MDSNAPDERKPKARRLLRRLPGYGDALQGRSKAEERLKRSVAHDRECHARELKLNRELVAQALAARPDLSDEEIARRVSCPVWLVTQARVESEARGPRIEALRKALRGVQAEQGLQP